MPDRAEAPMGDAPSELEARIEDGAGGGAKAGGEVDFAKVPVEEAFKTLNATPKGLTEAEAQKRLEEFGPNKQPDKTINPIMRFLGYLWNPLSWAMEVAAILAIILLDYADFALIVALLLLNATISFVEESNADKAIKALAGALAPKCKALRDGQVKVMDAENIVPGDVLLVRLGDIVPADIKLLGSDDGEEHAPMQIDQAALTGESLPVKKFTGDVAFSGSTIKQGERHAVVYATGVNTFFGRAASLISATNNVANIQKVMTKIGAICLITIGAWIVIELPVQFAAYEHQCKLGVANCPTLSNLLVIIVGGIPIAMPTVLSVTLALGAYQLAKQGAIVARMSAVEEMAGMDILCSDKTGTLTLNKLSIDTTAAFPMAGVDMSTLVKYGALSADTVGEEPIDMVLHNTYPDKDHLWDGYERLKFVPFNPTDKFTMAVIRDKQTGKVMRLMKGAPQVVLKRAHNFQEIHDQVEQKIADYANRGYRALGFGLAEGSGSPDAPGTHWEFLGLLPLFDPPRHDTAETIKRCQHMGIGVKMVTGDQLLIGKETARQLGMGTDMYKIEALLHAKTGNNGAGGSKQAGVEELVEKADGFAEVFPEHKFEIVEILQARRHMVGMTGDGVNDAPALKKADVGTAVHGATEAARGAADIVLTEPGLSVIVDAVIGARKIFQRMTTYAKYTVAMTFRVCFTFGILTIAYNWYFPTILIVLLAVFNDGAMIALSKDKVTPSPTPNTWHLRNVFIVGTVYGLFLTLSTWVLYHVAAKTTFFERRIHMFSLNDTDGELRPFCTSLITSLGQTNVNAPASVLGGDYTRLAGSVSLVDQCLAEQRYVRGSQLRTLIYNQVSISGQALVFVVRTAGHSLVSAAGGLTYLAFFLAQIASTLIAALGFGGYKWPPEGIAQCRLCLNSKMQYPHFFENRVVPDAGSESVFIASVIGCTYWIAVAWIWSIIWYVALDPLKWLLMWILNEEGVRNREGWRRLVHTRRGPKAKEAEAPYVHARHSVTYTNPMGRVSIPRMDSQTLSRASIISVDTHPVTGLRVVSSQPYRRVSADALQLSRRGSLELPISLSRRASLTSEGGGATHSPLARGSQEGAGRTFRRVSAETDPVRGAGRRAAQPVPRERLAGWPGWQAGGGGGGGGAPAPAGGNA